MRVSGFQAPQKIQTGSFRHNQIRDDDIRLLPLDQTTPFDFIARLQFLKTPDVSLGAPAWKKLWPKAVWPGAIPGIPPIAVRVLTDVNVRPTTPVHVNFDFPNGVAGYFAGAAGDTFSYFGNIFMAGST